MRLTARRGLLLAASLLIAGGLLYLSLRELDLSEVGRELAQASLPLLGLSVLVRLVALTVASVRSKILLAPMHDFGLYRLFKSLLLAFVVQNIVPLRAGEIARVGYLARYGGISASSCLAVAATERLVDLFMLVALFLAVLPTAAIDLPIDLTLYLICAVAAAAVLAAVLVSKYPERFVAICKAIGGLLGAPAAGFVESKSALFARGLSALGSIKAVLAAASLSTLYWLCAATSMHLWIRAVGLDLGWQAPVVVLAFLALGLAVPTTPGNIGTYHFLAYTAMLRLGVEEVQAGSFALLSHAMSIIPTTLMAVVLLGDVLQARRSPEPS